MTWRAIHRITHLPGGLRLLNRIGPSVEFDPGDGRGSREVLVLQHYDALFVAAAGLGVLPIGVEMVVSPYMPIAALYLSMGERSFN